MSPSVISPTLRRLARWRDWLRVPSWSGHAAALLWPRQLAGVEEAINTCNSALARFGRATDEEFAGLARGLGSLNGSLAEIRRQNAEFQLVIEDRDSDRTIASAQEVYKRSVDLVHSSIGIAATEQQQMASIEQALGTACGAGAEFRRNQMLLNIITMSIRMEATRLDSDHRGIFINVGDAIGGITRKITTSTETAFERIEAIVAELRAERAHLQEIEQDLNISARESIDTIQHELSALQARLAPCIEQGRTNARLLGETEPLMLRTISCLQHQDIVRQQLEHVAAGFSDLQQHLREARAGTPAVAPEPGYIHQAASVQHAHLGSSRHEIDRASSDVVAGLRALLTASTALVDGYAAMESAGSAAFANFCIVGIFQEEIKQLTSIADKSKETNGKISRLVGRIEEVVSVFAGEVTEHELEVKIVALNAQVAAARVPSAEALNRLAEETSRVSEHNSTVTRLLLRDLQASLEQLRSIRASTLEFLDVVTAERGELESGIVTVTQKLTRLSQRAQSDLGRVRSAFSAAHSDIEQLLQGLKLATLIEESFQPAEQLCERLLTLSQPLADKQPLSAAAVARLEAHRSRYTMQKENTTHTSALAGSAVAAAATPATDATPAASAEASIPAPGAGADDGIELF